MSQAEVPGTTTSYQVGNLYFFISTKVLAMTMSYIAGKASEVLQSLLICHVMFTRNEGYYTGSSYY